MGRKDFCFLDKLITDLISLSVIEIYLDNSYSVFWIFFDHSGTISTSNDPVLVDKILPFLSKILPLDGGINKKLNLYFNQDLYYS